MEQRTHRVWAHAAVAWPVMVAIPTLHQAIRWFVVPEHRDIDMTSVWELVSSFVMALTVPMGALAFGVFGVLAAGLDRQLGGRTTRRTNVLAGTALAIPAFAVLLLWTSVTGWRSIVSFGIRASIANVFLHPEPLVTMTAIFVTAGVIVGLGLRHANAPAAR